MVDTTAIAPTPRWWPGRTSAIISAALAVLALPFVAYSVWAFVQCLTAFPCDASSAHACEHASRDAFLGFVAGTAGLVVASSLLMGATGLYLCPGVRGRVIGAIGRLMIGLPIIFLVTERTIWLFVR